MRAGVTDDRPATGSAEPTGFSSTVARRSRRSGFDAIAEGGLDDVVADIFGPAGDETGKPPPVVREQGPRGFFEARQIAGHRRHEMIGGISCSPATIAITARATRLLDPLSQRHRRAAGLR